MEVEKAYVFNIQHYSLHDGPGIRTTVFLKGCPLRCRWCCNPESQSMSPEQMGEKTAGTLMSVEEILKEVEKDEIFYHHGDGGMTVSGGEPLVQGAFLVELLREAKKHYLSTAMETSGYGSQEVLLEAAQYLDVIYYDIKSLNREKHKAWIGQSNQLILENFKALKENFPELTVCVRTPVIPNFNDTEEDIRQICEYLSGFSNISYELLAYHFYGKQKYEELNRLYPMGKEVLAPRKYEQLKKVVREYGLELRTAS